MNILSSWGDIFVFSPPFSILILWNISSLSSHSYYSYLVERLHRLRNLRLLLWLRRSSHSVTHSLYDMDSQRSRATHLNSRRGSEPYDTTILYKMPEYRVIQVPDSSLVSTGYLTDRHRASSSSVSEPMMHFRARLLQISRKIWERS